MFFLYELQKVSKLNHKKLWTENKNPDLVTDTVIDAKFIR